MPCTLLARPIGLFDVLNHLSLHKYVSRVPRASVSSRTQLVISGEQFALHSTPFPALGGPAWSFRLLGPRLFLVLAGILLHSLNQKINLDYEGNWTKDCPRSLSKSTYRKLRIFLKKYDPSHIAIVKKYPTEFYCQKATCVTIQPRWREVFCSNKWHIRNSSWLSGKALPATRVGGKTHVALSTFG
jgi:hypothetical protein